ncbi:SH3 domain-containing protein [Sphingomonas sp. HF-S4]|uniref:SH3 domain-containing protein n=1 Tax=Sphingomonas agrestis TaxID=3080540 RepID=A0ABU3Y9X5_9SPHN|nr:SH3 domain-containing protein [Sphingomonas sp. HF-S4]MDV3458210.1 SH3 domain-containing protein [Sphingomonas sp. HF-S4]
MSDDVSPKKSFDISQALKPAKAVLPGIGEVSVRIRTVSFLKWFGEGERRRRWADGADFLRVLLRERVAPPEDVEEADKPGLDAAFVEELDSGQLETIAEQLLVAATPIFRSLGASRKKGANTEGSADTVGSDGEGRPTDRLLVGARRYLLDFETGQKEAASRITQSLGVGSVMRELHRYNRLAELGRTVDRLSLGMIEQTRLEQLARGDAFGRAFGEHDTISKLFAATAQIGTIGNLSKLLGLTQMDRDRWISASRLLGLGISSSVLAAAQGLTASSMMSQFEREAAAMYRPGYQSLASLALEGEIARGAASDLLHEYDTERREAPLFDAVLDAIETLDDDEASPAERLALLETVIGLIRGAAGWARSEVQKAGVVSLIAAVAAILALYPDLIPWRGEAEPNKEMVEAVAEIKGLRADFEAARDVGDRKHIRYVHGRANLRAAPERQGLVIRIVYPDQWVEVRDARGDWARVAVYDYSSDAPAEGWIHRGNLRVAPE